MTDSTQELRKQLRMRLQDMYGTLSPSEQLIDEYIMPFILDWHNKQVEAVLDRLPLDCENCGRRTLVLEAQLRNFKTGMCGNCRADALVTSFWAIKAERTALYGKDEK